VILEKETKYQKPLRRQNRKPNEQSIRLDNKAKQERENKTLQLKQKEFTRERSLRAKRFKHGVLFIGRGEGAEAHQSGN
jgi:hypothetical protein